MAILKRAALIPLALLLTGFTMNMEQTAEMMSNERARMPRGNTIYICSEVGCQKRTKFKFTSFELNHMAQIMSFANNATSERAQLRKALGWIDKRLCHLAGTCGDLPGIHFWKSGQMDCVDEALNATWYLSVLARNRLLKFHLVAKPVWKGFPVAHWAALICERGGTKQCIVVDMDFNYPGDEPAMHLQKNW